jgi:hypothetical protein
VQLITEREAKVLREECEGKDLMLRLAMIGKSITENRFFFARYRFFSHMFHSARWACVAEY